MTTVIVTVAPLVVHLAASAVTAIWKRPANPWGSLIWTALNWLALNVGNATNAAG